MIDKYFKFRFLTILIVVIVILISSCEHAEDPTGPPKGIQPTFESIQTNIFSPSCALSGCHAGSNPQQDMNLSEGQAYENIVNVSSNEVPKYLRVDPQDPDSSYLVMKIEGDERIIGQRMPAGSDPLSDEEIQAIREWIENGAQR